jgi:hypothetical protein
MKAAFTTADTEDTEDARSFKSVFLCAYSVRSVSAVVNLIVQFTQD